MMKSGHFLARHKKHLLVCGAFILLSFFLLGAGRATRCFMERTREAHLEKTRWSRISQSFAAELPEEQARQWLEFCELDPHGFLLANTSELRRESLEETAVSTVCGGESERRFGMVLLGMFKSPAKNSRNWDRKR